MRSPGNGVCQPQCESVKVLSPEIIPYCIGLRVSLPGSRNRYVRNGECTSASRGLSPWRASELSMLELGRTEAFQREAVEERKKRRGGMAQSVVGLTHSRGVGRVTPVAGQNRPLEGVSGIAQRGGFKHAAP